MTKVICRDETCKNNKNLICILKEIELIVDEDMVCIDYVTKYKSLKWREQVK